jgi:hypothetical protein
MGSLARYSSLISTVVRMLEIYMHVYAPIKRCRRSGHGSSQIFTDLNQ